MTRARTRTQTRCHSGGPWLLLVVSCPFIFILFSCCGKTPSEPEETGTVVVDAEPDSLNAPWELSGSGRYSHSGSGDETLTDMDVGDYTITWGDVSGYTTPSPETQTLVANETVTFAGTYVEEGGFEPPEMITVPAGSFTMGDPGDPGAYCADEHEVTLTYDFYLGQHEVTNQEYLEAVQWAYDQGHVTATTSSVRDNLDGSTEELLDLDDVDCEISFSGGVFSCINPDHPVKEVTWYGAVRYCDWLSLASGLPRAYEHSGDWLCNNHDPYTADGYRLPTDAEWEYAAQHNDDRIYPWGNESPNCDLANYSGCEGWTLPVGSCPDGNSALGFSDLAGNVWEWCNDWFVCDLGTAPVTDPVGPGSGIGRVVRGGAWDGPDFLLRCAPRNIDDPEYSGSSFGFRSARTVNP